MHYDFIIVGSGSVGAAAGYYATRAGLKVLMLDSFHPPHQEGSHHGDTRLIRYAYGEGEKYVPLVLRARALWNELQELSQEKVFEKTGVVNLGPAGSTFLANVARSAQQFGLPLERLDAAGIRTRWPEMSVPNDYIALFEPDSGVLRSENAVREWIRLAKDAGCAQQFNCPVSAIESTPEGVSVTTAAETFTGSKVLVSAGTWAGKLLPSLPVVALRKVFTWFQADGRYSSNNHFPAFTAEMPNGDFFYGFPAENDALKVGKHNGGQLIHTPEERKPFGGYPADGSEAFPFLRTILPGIGGCLYGASCTYDNSPDEDFIIDTLPENASVMAITGLSGHGFKFAPALGEIAARFAAGLPYDPDISAFSLARFR